MEAQGEGDAVEAVEAQGNDSGSIIERLSGSTRESRHRTQWKCNGKAVEAHKIKAVEAHKGKAGAATHVAGVVVQAVEGAGLVVHHQHLQAAVQQCSAMRSALEI